MLKTSENKTNKINDFAMKDKLTVDNKYNKGLKTIRKYGYEQSKTDDNVKYYCLCNNL